MSQTHRVSWLLAGVGLLGLMTTLMWLSPHFIFERSLLTMPVWWVVATLALAGVILCTLPALIENTPPERWLLVWVIGLGVALRCVTMTSVPILEDDFYRYLWDGAVLSKGVNPYQYSPQQAWLGEGVPSLEDLAHNSPLVAQRINHPHLTTVYPPVAQGGFVLAYWLAPWSLGAWKSILFVAEGLTLWILCVILKVIHRSPLWVALYWWNPLLIKEYFNSAHVDGLLLPLLLGALLLTLRRRALAACVCLALAVGVKVWPILLLPIVIKGACARARDAWASAGVFVFLVGLQSVPIVTAGVGKTSGLLAYARTWEMNDALFMGIHWTVRQLAECVGQTAADTPLLARLLVGLVVLVVSLLVSFRDRLNERRVIETFLVITGMLFLLSPTQYPWYYTWLVPLLCLHRCFALLMLTPLLSLYYSRFYFDARGQVEMFDYRIVWVEYGPVWLLLGWQGLTHAKRWFRHA